MTHLDLVIIKMYGEKYSISNSLFAIYYIPLALNSQYR